jgi:putative aldouronate transport system permease protein
MINGVVKLSLKVLGNKLLNIKKSNNSELLTRKKIDNFQLLLLAIPAIVLIFIFSYIPMGGIVIAFKQFKVPLGIFGSPWVGLKNFEFFFKSEDAWRTIRNTLGMNLLMISVHLVCNIAFAMLCFRLKSKLSIKFYQTATIIPSFLSYVIVGYLVYALLKPMGGVANQIIEALGGKSIQWYISPGKWPVILLLTSLWHGVGQGSLFYFASLVGIDKEYFEAASLDGASKWQEFRYIILPFLTPIIVIMQILAIGKIFRADFGLFFNVTRDMGALYSTTDVIDTYIYRALITLGDIGMSASVGVFQSVVGFILIIFTNYIVRKIEADYSFF